MKYIKNLLAAVLLLFFVTVTFAADEEGFQFNKKPELQYVKPKKPVRIKLKRTSTGKYSWDLTGDDVDEILKADKKLRKMLNLK